MGYIRIKNIGKAYKRYSRKSGRLLEWLGLGVHHELIWVLKDVSFDVEPGEAVGIIGINGAGKSTLLKIITGTIRPTTGTVEVGGRVSALLELGMGFHPDFTGRENVYMAAQLKGMTHDEVSQKMREIEEFAEIGDYIDQPVRVYSSGMQVRLAFSVATCVRPDILIVDEALSVGDAAFQRKCFRRIEGFRALGTTLLFVSHSTETVKKICDSAVFLNKGVAASIGEAKQVCDEYERFLFGGSAQNKLADKPSDRPIVLLEDSLVSSCEVSYGTYTAVIEQLWLSNDNAEQINVLFANEPFFVNYLVRFHEDVVNPVFAMMIKTKEGIAVYGTDTKWLKVTYDGIFRSGAIKKISFRLQNHLAPGIYYLNCGIRDDKQDVPVFLHRRVDALIFRVAESSATTAGTGLLELYGDISIEDVA